MSGTISEVVDALASEKSDLIKDVRSDVRGYISSRTIWQCLSVVELNSSGEPIRTHRPELDRLHNYMPAFVCFLRRARYNGHALDSALSKPVADQVANRFSSFVEARSETISAAVVDRLVRSDAFVSKICEAIVQSSNSAVPAALRAKVTAALKGQVMSSLQTQLQSGSVQAMTTAIGKTVGAAVATPIGVKVSAMVLKAAVVKLQPIIIKILGSAAFKGALAAKIKAIIAATVLGSVVAALAAKLGISVAGAWMLILLPIVAGWLAYEAASFPEKLADKVSSSVASELSGSFDKTTRDALESVVSYAMSEGAGVITQAVVAELDVEAELSGLVADAMS